MISFTQTLDGTGPELRAARRGVVSDATDGPAAQEYQRLNAISRRGERWCSGQVMLFTDGADLVLKLPTVTRDASGRPVPVLVLARREEAAAADFVGRLRTDAVALDRQLDEAAVRSDLPLLAPRPQAHRPALPWLRRILPGLLRLQRGLAPGATGPAEGRREDGR